jgi:hypothetical protein
VPQSAQKNETNLTFISEENKRVLSDTENNNRTAEMEFSNVGMNRPNATENQLL